MSESYVKTQVGAINEDAYAFVIKVDHPNAAVVILKHECSVILYDAHALSHESVIVRQAISTLTESDAEQVFTETLGACITAVYTDPVFKNADPKKHGRVILPVFTNRVDREKLAEYAQGGFNCYKEFVTPPSNHLKPRYHK